MIKNTYFKSIKKEYPNVKKRDISIFNDGWRHLVFVVEGKYAFRFSRKQDYAKKLLQETAFLEDFYKISPVLVPYLTLHYMSDSAKPYVTYEFIPGVQFTRVLSKQFSVSERLKIAQQLGKFLTVLHSYPIEKARRFGIKSINQLSAWRNKFYAAKRVVSPCVSKNEKEWIIHLFRIFFEILRKKSVNPVLTHSDFMPEHIIVNSETHKLMGIIDFDDISITDPAFDFAFLNKYGKDFLDAFYKSYTLTRDEMFEQRRQFYEDYLMIANLKYLIELKDENGIKEHRQRLSNYIKSHPFK